MKKVHPSLLQKALLAIVLILLPIFALFIHDYLDVKEQLRADRIKQNRALAEGYEGMVYAFLEMSKRRAQDFSSDGEIKGYLQGILDGKRGLDKQLGKYLSTYNLPLDKTIYRIDIVSLDDRILASTEDTETGKSFSTTLKKVKTPHLFPNFEQGPRRLLQLLFQLPSSARQAEGRLALLQTSSASRNFIAYSWENTVRRPVRSPGTCLRTRP